MPRLFGSVCTVGTAVVSPSPVVTDPSARPETWNGILALSTERATIGLEKIVSCLHRVAV